MNRNRDRDDGGRIAERLLRFADYVEAESPLNATFCRVAAPDPVVAEILSGAPFSQPVANILLAAVQFLLLDGTDPDLAAHYDTLRAPGPRPDGDPGRLFIELCHRRRDDLAELAATRTVQTNEVRRCTGLLPAFTLVEATRGPLALIEVGASAGLNLRFDRYRYDYGDGLVVGPEQADLRLSTESRGATPPVSDPLPTVVWRIGIDLDPVDVTDAESVRWARSLLWPEQVDRVDRFERAVAAAALDPPIIVRGNGVDLISEVAARAPDDARLVVFHSYTFNQVDAASKVRFDRALRELGRPVDRIAIEFSTEDPQPSLVHRSYSADGVSETTLATVHHHGAWIDWYA